ncbi:amidohydrolase family protein [Ornithinimicrobium cavernae]|uniref:amidohydrolase family protein n=1 Tax=Ornithinimicrobium cavernae TaxID=2666047 RepID=UPI00192A462F|nr:amidohydrolase family protein [Ornithinimicrobium cavernae]
MSPQPAEVEVTEGTNIAAAHAPDGSTVIDLHGILYSVPPGGGEAQALTTPLQETARPDVAPDGRLAFQAYAGGQFHIWTAGADGSDPQQVTTGQFDHREPRWSADGQEIVFSSDRGGSYDIWSIDVASGELTQWTTDGGQEFEPSFSPDADEVVYVGGNEIWRTDRAGDSELVVPAPDGRATVHSPSVGPDGEQVAWIQRDGTVADLMIDDRQLTDGEDVFLFTPDWVDDSTLLYTTDGGVRTRDIGAEESTAIPFAATISLEGGDYEKKAHDFDSRKKRDLAGVLTPQLSPDGESVLFVALNDLWLMPIDGKPEQLTDDDFHEVNPVFSPDGTQIAYSSDRAGTEDIYIRNLEDGSERRVTAMDSAEVSASFSPDASQLAFQDQTGATYVLDLASGEARELVPSVFGPGRPTWSADGSTIAFAAVKQYSERFREGTSQILTVDVETGLQQFYAPGAEHDSISTRGDDGPVWSPDGSSMLFVEGSTLKSMPVDSSGQPTGPPRQINDEVADAPSWSGDSTQVLYLSNGDLRLADAETGEARTIDVPLTVRPDIQTGRTVIHAGAFWDGESRDLREDVDITVIGNRIHSIEPHHRSHHGGEVIDASGLTVMPGLMDSHVHQAYESRFFGDRQGRISLAYGITSTLSVGDQVYRAMEDRDSLDAGERVGPRFYATGEPIDGSRVYYNFMRPTSTDEDVQRELTRAEALDYDFLKTYVRLPASRMATVIDEAHRLGVPSSSHYLSPGALVGQDGTTHLAATQRLGFARTITATGFSYADVPALYGEGERTVTTTMFTTDFLRADEVAEDPRLPLLPPWKRESLLERVADNVTEPVDPLCETAPCQEAQTFQRIAQEGGVVLVGTDSPLDNVGLGVHANLQEMVGYGWDPYDALRAAIVNPSEYLGVSEDVGSLAPGKVADLIAVDGNPLEDIEAAARVELTMVGGKAYTQDELMAPFTGVAPLEDTPRTSDEALPAATVTERADRSVTERYWWHDPEIVAEQYAHACDAYEALEHQRSSSWASGDGDRHDH